MAQKKKSPKVVKKSSAKKKIVKRTTKSNVIPLLDPNKFDAYGRPFSEAQLKANAEYTLKLKRDEEFRVKLQSMSIEEISNLEVQTANDINLVFQEVQLRSKTPIKAPLGKRQYAFAIKDVYYSEGFFGPQCVLSIDNGLYDVVYDRNYRFYDSDFKTQTSCGVVVTPKKISSLLNEYSLSLSNQQDLDDHKDLCKQVLDLSRIPGKVVDVTGEVLVPSFGWFGPPIFAQAFGSEKYPRVGIIEPQLELSDSAYADPLEEEEKMTPFLRIFSLDMKSYIFVDIRDVKMHQYQENMIDKLVLPAELKSIVSSVFDAKDVFGDLFTGRHGGMIIMANGSPGTGKCLGKGTPVLMADGSVRPVETIVAGEQLMGPDGNIRNVLGTTIGNSELFKINPVKGDSWTCNDVHMMTVVHSGTDEISDIPLNEFLQLSKSHQERSKLFSVGIDNFQRPEYKLPIDPYFLGVWFGDGSKHTKELISGKTVLTELAISKPDLEIKNLCEKIASDWKMRIREDLSASCPTYHIVNIEKSNSNKILDTVRGLVGDEIIIPENYICAPRNERLEFLAGFLDADAELNDNCFIITQKRKDWADAIWRIAKSLGFCATRKTRTGTIKREDGSIFEGLYNVVTISGDMDQIPTKIPRKQAFPRKQIKVATRTGFTVEPIGKGDYYGFTLDSDGRFLLGDYTVTHNTLSAEVFAEKTKRPLYVLEMGELGVNVATVEESLQKIFARAARWNAVLLFDEADIFLSKRTEHDLERNAIVGVFLRLLDQYRGMLFLTTNRAEVIDSAFSSRITLRLDYPEHTVETRAQIWKHMFNAADLKLTDEAGNDPDFLAASTSEALFKKLGESKLNGRQVRNVVRLLKAVTQGNIVTLTSAQEYIKYSPTNK